MAGEVGRSFLCMADCWGPMLRTQQKKGLIGALWVFRWFCVWCRRRPVFPAPSVEGSVLSLLCVLTPSS